MTVAQVRAELVTKLKTVDPVSGRTFGYAPDSIEPPAAFVGGVVHDPRAAMGGEAALTGFVWVCVSTAASINRSVDALDKYTEGGTYDVAAALQTSSAVWDDLAVTGSEWPVFDQIGASTYAFVRFDIEIYL